MSKVSEIMRRNVVSIAPDRSVADAARRMRDCGEDFVAISENGRFKGLLTREIIVLSIATDDTNPKRCKVGQLVNNRLPKVPPGIDVIEAAKIMARQNIRYMPVVQNGLLQGILTLEDILRESPALAIIVMTRQNEINEGRKKYAMAQTA